MLNYIEKNKYIIGPVVRGDIAYAGAKFPLDLISIAFKHKYKSVFIHEKYGINCLRCFSDLFKLLKIKQNSSVIYIDQLTNSLSRNMAYAILKLKKCNIYSLIEDVDILRNNYTDKEKNKIFYKLNYAKKIISQNAAMTKYLKKYCKKIDFFELKILDFLYNGKIVNKYYDDKYSICYGGNITKEQAGFIKDFPYSKNVKLNVYGNKIQDFKIKNNVKFYKKFPSNHFIKNMKGSFGLVWNGPSIYIDKNNKQSTYYNYVCPHKFSLYILLSIPVIVYNKSAMAEFVKKEKCGILIDNLNEIENKIKNTSKKEYLNYKNNAIRVAKLIKIGYYFNKILSNIDMEM